MKSPWEWDESDLQALITDQVKESIELDYKRCASLDLTEGKKNEVSKDVSAFANSGGGTIVYGMIENGHVPTAIDVGFDPSGPITKEWLEQVINSSRIQRRIDGVRIDQIELRESYEGKVAYVVYVPQSPRAPHMAADHKFYKRFNFESVPMEEYEVRDVSRRGEAPDLRMALALTDGPVVHLSGDAPPLVSLEARVLNESATPAEYAMIQLEIDGRLNVFKPGGLSQLRDARTVSLADRRFSVNVLQRNWGIPSDLPIWEGIRFLVAVVVLQLPPGYRDYVIGYWVRSPHMTPSHHYHYLKQGDDVSLHDAPEAASP